MIKDIKNWVVACIYQNQMICFSVYNLNIYVLTIKLPKEVINIPYSSQTPSVPRKYDCEDTSPSVVKLQGILY